MAVVYQQTRAPVCSGIGPCLAVGAVEGVVVGSARCPVVILHGNSGSIHEVAHLKRHVSHIDAVGGYAALHDNVIQAYVLAVATQSGAVLQQQHSGAERGCGGIVALEQQLLAAAHVHHRLAVGIVFGSHLAAVLLQIPRLEAAVVNSVAYAQVACDVAAVAHGSDASVGQLCSAAVYIVRCLHELVVPMVVGNVSVGLSHRTAVVCATIGCCYRTLGSYVYCLDAFHYAINKRIVEYAISYTVHITVHITVHYRRGEIAVGNAGIASNIETIGHGIGSRNSHRLKPGVVATLKQTAAGGEQAAHGLGNASPRAIISLRDGRCLLVVHAAIHLGIGQREAQRLTVDVIMHEHIAALARVVVGVDACKVGSSLKVVQGLCPAAAVGIVGHHVGLYVDNRAQRSLVLVGADVNRAVGEARAARKVALGCGDVAIGKARHIISIMPVAALVKQRQARAYAVVAALHVGIERVAEVGAFLYVLVVDLRIAGKAERMIMVIIVCRDVGCLVVPRDGVED